jgi:DNA invertase Pin-like site-specific DNA recombinase
MPRLGWVAADEIALRQSRYDPEEAADARRQILGRIAKGDIDVLAVWALDRITREGPEAALSFVRTLEQHYGVSLYSHQEPFLSTATANPEVRQLIMSILAWAANQESARRGARLRAKAHTKRQRAAQLGQRAIWGKGKMPLPEDYERVRAAKARDLSVRAIAEETGIPRSTVDRMLKSGGPTEALGHDAAPEGARGPRKGRGLGQGVQEP